MDARYGEGTGESAPRFTRRRLVASGAAVMRPVGSWGAEAALVRGIAMRLANINWATIAGQWWIQDAGGWHYRSTFALPPDPARRVRFETSVTRARVLIDNALWITALNPLVGYPEIRIADAATGRTVLFQALDVRQTLRWVAAPGRLVVVKRQPDSGDHKEFDVDFQLANGPFGGGG